MKPYTLADCLTEAQRFALIDFSVKKANIKATKLLSKEVNKITLGELRLIGGALKGTEFTYESDTIAALKLLYNAITETF